MKAARQEVKWQAFNNHHDDQRSPCKVCDRQTDRHTRQAVVPPELTGNGKKPPVKRCKHNHLRITCTFSSLHHGFVEIIKT